MNGNSHKHRKRYRHAQCNGKPDSDILFKIKKCLRKEYHIPFNRIKIEHAIQITRGGCVLLGRLTREKISQTKGLVRTPDIIITDGSGKPQCIIEQDGEIHESERQMKKDKTRSRHYGYAGIPCIVLNTKKIRAERKKPYIYLDEMMRRIEITK